MNGLWRDLQEERRWEHDNRYREHSDRITFRVTLLSIFIAFLAAAAAIWTGYEAHKTRINDQRPFIAVDISIKDPEPNTKSVNALTTAGRCAEGSLR